MVPRKSDVSLVAATSVAALAAGALGFGAGLTTYDAASADSTGALEGRLGHYTYGGSNCSDGDEIDPVNVLFVLDGFTDWVFGHAADHGEYIWHDGTSQHFKEGIAAEGGPWCRLMDGQVASALSTFDRYHMRLARSQNENGDPFVYSKLGVVSMADAHYEVVRLCGHSVADQGTSFSFTDINGGKYWVDGGFNRGREDILKNWVIEGGHTQVQASYWDNDIPMQQCDPIGGDPDIAWSSGWVYYIGTKAFH